jgi:hypothetical protein
VSVAAPAEPARQPPVELRAPRRRDQPARYPCEGREYYDRKRAEGKNTKEAIRALKRQLSNVVYRTLVADARRLEQ